MLAAVDGKAQARAIGGDKFQVSIAGPTSADQLQPVVSDNSNGTYNVSWSTTVAGDYLLTAKLEGYTVGGCPVSCTGKRSSMKPYRAGSRSIAGAVQLHSG